MAQSFPSRLLENYLTALGEVRRSSAGVAETSYYGAVETLFNTAGQALSPKVRCILSLANRARGAGIADGGLFTADQYRRQADHEPMRGQSPARGAMEVKPPEHDMDALASSEQARKYLNEYGLVLLTNLRQFRILEQGPDGRPVERESFTLAESADDFWQSVIAHPRASARRRGVAFADFIQRCCLHAAPLTNPRDLAWFLASYARDALDRLEKHADLPALQQLRQALQEALGMRFTDEKGEHLFRSTLVQTLFYGVFSAWVLWHRAQPSPNPTFDWRSAEWSLHVPFIRALYEQLATPSRLQSLRLVQVLEWTAAALNRVDRAEFFRKFQDQHAVQYFYEPFLEAYDPELRRQMGVWYTPPEIVQYQVRRVDAVLQSELNLPDGLADPNVIVLDPCCGTGAYLVETLRLIEQRLKERGESALAAADLKQAATGRLFGFEILPAPFVVAHLQLGLLLQTAGAPLSHDANERAGVYLTNALTGWEPPEGAKQQLMFEDLAQERDAAEQVKRDKKILVILGNPPYNAFAGVSPEEEQGLVDPYKKNLNAPVAQGGWGIKKFNLDDLYVRFFRIAERRIAEMSGRGVVSFISNFSYLSDPSFVVMRQRYLHEFDALWFDCLNGDSRETGKLTPQGKPDPSVFSTDYNREGIRVGTAVSVIVRKPDHNPSTKAGRQVGAASAAGSADSRSTAAEAAPTESCTQPIVRFRHFWGTTKRQDLLDSLDTPDFNAAYTPAQPTKANRYSFRPENVSKAYAAWPMLTELCEVPPSNGLMEKRGGALIDIDKKKLIERMRDYFDGDLSWEEYKTRHTALTTDAARFNAKEARKKGLRMEQFDAGRILQYAIRPFETRWCYYTPVRPIWNEPRPTLWEQCFEGNAFVLSRPAGVANPEGIPLSFTRCLGDNDYQRGHSYYFSFLLPPHAEDSRQMMGKPLPTANLSKMARQYLADLGAGDPDADRDVAALIWHHALAIGYSPAYLDDNADGIRRDWPRIPLPRTLDALLASARLGQRIAALLDVDRPVVGVTAGAIEPPWRDIAVLTHRDGKRIDPASDDLAVTAGWGHAGKNGVTMPGKGQVVAREGALDIDLNEAVCWQNVPQAVWDYTIGGYQVLKKWLSYREKALLGRALMTDEARHFTAVARRLAALLALGEALDINYRAMAADVVGVEA